MSDRQVELTTKAGHIFRLELLASEPTYYRWMVTLRDTKRGEEWAQQLRDEDVHELAELIGYPRPIEDRTVALQKQLDALTAAHRVQVQALTEAHQVEAQALAELERAKENVRELVELLTDAWWLKAAASYRRLAAWVNG